MVFQAAADEEPFTDVEVVTLKQAVLDDVMADAIKACTAQKIDGNQEQMLREYISANPFVRSIREFISVANGHVTVGVNRDSIDDEAIDHGLSLLEKVSSFDSGSYVEFGPRYGFDPATIVK